MTKQALKEAILLSHTYTQLLFWLHWCRFLMSPCRDISSASDIAGLRTQPPAKSGHTPNSPKGKSSVGASWKVKHPESKLQVL